MRGAEGYIDEGGMPHLNVLDLQMQIRRLPKPVVAMVAGYAIGGGHVLHLVCDLTIAADNARFGQTGPRVGSFDAGLGAGLMARTVGLKKAKEIWLLCRQYDAQQALQMGWSTPSCRSNCWRKETVQWCREMLQLSPMALRMIKAGFNADTDGLAGIQELAGNATGLFTRPPRGRKGATPIWKSASLISPSTAAARNPSEDHRRPAASVCTAPQGKVAQRCVANWGTPRLAARTCR